MQVFDRTQHRQAATTLTIGQLAAEAGVGVETVRYYQRRGLLEEPARNGGYRRYDGAHVERLRFIKRAQAVGFQLNEITSLLQLNDLTDHARARILAREKIADIEGRIRQLQTVADALHHLVQECEHHPDGMPCPIIRMALPEDLT